MPIYLDTFTGTGTETDPFRPALADVTPGQWHMIDLRRDPSVATGRCIVRCPAPPSLPADTQALGATEDSRVANVIRRRMENRLGLPDGALDDVPIRQLLVRLLVDLGTEDGTRWRPLKPLSHGPNAWEIHLGGLIYSVPRIQGGASCSDDFNRSNASTLGANWSSTTSWGIVSNRAQTANSNDAIAVHNTTMDSDDHFSEFTYQGVDSEEVMVVTRAESPANHSDFYGFRQNAIGTAFEIWKNIGGAFTKILDQSGTATSGDVLRLECDGSTLTGYKNGVFVGSVTDTALSGSTQRAVGIRATNSGLQVDDFNAADLGAATQDIAPSGIASAEAFGTATIPTRFYWGSIAVTGPSAVASAWESQATTPLDYYTLYADRSDIASITYDAVTETDTVARDVAAAGFVSDPLAAQTIEGTFSCVITASQFDNVGTAHADADMSLQAVIRVMSGDLSTERGVLYAGHSAALNSTPGALGEEISATFASRSSRIFDGVALSSVAAQEGDRLVVELGARAHNTSANEFGATLRHQSGSTDMALTSGLTGTGAQWIQFSGYIEFDSAQIIDLTDNGIATGQAFGSATLTTGAVTIAPTGIASAESVPSPVVTQTQSIAPSGITSAEALGSPTLTTGAVTVSPTGIASAEAFGTAALGAAAQEILTTGIDSVEAFGTAALGLAIAPTGIPSAEVIGGPIALTQEIFIASTPYTAETPAARRAHFDRVSIRRGLTVYVIDGVYATTRWPEDGSLDHADAVYYGGRDYEVTAALADELEAEGFTIRTEIR